MALASEHLSAPCALPCYGSPAAGTTCLHHLTPDLQLLCRLLRGITPAVSQSVAFSSSSSCLAVLSSAQHQAPVQPDLSDLRLTRQACSAGYSEASRRRSSRAWPSRPAVAAWPCPLHGARHTCTAWLSRHQGALQGARALRGRQTRRRACRHTWRPLSGESVIAPTRLQSDTQDWRLQKCRCTVIVLPGLHSKNRSSARAPLHTAHCTLCRSLSTAVHCGCNHTSVHGSHNISIMTSCGACFAHFSQVQLATSVTLFLQASAERRSP